MKNGRNESGYVLIVVLLLIVFITIISAVFMRGSLSTASQDRIVDVNNLAVVAAEMGVDYYKTAVQNKFENEKVLLQTRRRRELTIYLPIKRVDFSANN